MIGLLFQKLAQLSRPVVIAFMVAGLFGIIAMRGSYIALSGPEIAGDERRLVNRVGDLPKRADIIDRNGELLATSVAVYSLYADPRAIWDAGQAADQLAHVFDDLDRDLVVSRLSKQDKKFVWIRRGLTPRQRQAVFDLGLEGVGFKAENKRVYPRGALSGHVLGHTNVDGKGQKGVELSMQEKLADQETPLQLTLDSGVQFVLEAELDRAAEHHQAIGAMGLVVEASTGKIRGLASWPAFNPNRPAMAGDEERRNRVVNATYELGSIFKPLTVAGALEAGRITLEERFDVRAPMIIRGKAIADTHKAGARMTAGVILAESSNVGTVQIGQRLGEAGLEGFFANLGLLEAVAIDLPASAKPQLPPQWTDLAAATASYGHGIAVSPLAFARAFASLANNGVLTPLQIIEAGEPVSGQRVMSQETAQAIVQMLRGVVLNGTGARGDALGYRVAGKTGTAEKPIVGGYASDQNITSFAALFPADRPEYVVLIVLDDPKAATGDGGVTAAWNAAPVASRVIAQIAPILGVLPEFDQAALGRPLPDRSQP